MKPSRPVVPTDTVDESGMAEACLEMKDEPSLEDKVDLFSSRSNTATNLSLAGRRLKPLITS